MFILYHIITAILILLLMFLEFDIESELRSNINIIDTVCELDIEAMKVKHNNIDILSIKYIYICIYILNISGLGSV